MNINTDEQVFPIGMRVLVVDDDQVFVKLLVNHLEKFRYNVTIKTEAIATMELLQNEKVDLIIIDANMLGMEGRKLFENVASLNIPFILLSSNVSKEFFIKGVGYGACDFISKPNVRLYELQNIWRHVVTKRNELKTKKLKTPASIPIESFQTPNKLSVVENFNHNSKVYGKRRKDHTNGECDEKIKHAILLKKKKRRVVWSQDLHHKFIAVVDKIGVENAVPKKILELLSDENLTRENVASHLQKYRLSLKKSSQPAKKTTSFGGCSNPTYGQNFSGVNNIQNISNNRSVSHSIPSCGFSSPRVTRWDQASTFMNVNDNIYSGIQMDRRNNMFPGLSTPLVEFDCVNQPYVAPGPFVLPSNLGDFNKFHQNWTQTQSPRLSCPSNDSTENMLTCASGPIANELYDWNSHRFQFYNQFKDYKLVDPELLSDGSTFFGDDYNLLRGIRVNEDGQWLNDDNSQIVNGGMISNLKQQNQVDDYVPMQPR